MLENKTTLITGGIGDLGSEMAYQLAQHGANVVLWDVKHGEEVFGKIARIEELGVRVMYQPVDVRDRRQIDEAVNIIMDDFGSIDIACVNAGIVESSPFLEIDSESWNKHIDINLTGAFHTAQAVTRKMVESNTQGRIIFTSSWVGSIPWPEITAYTVTKAGINMLVKQMAKELAVHGIRVNAVAPGIVKAGLAGRQLVEEPQYAARVAKVIPLGEPGTPVEVAQAVIYLASPQTAYMTGSILTIDGGCSLFQFDQ